MNLSRYFQWLVAGLALCLGLGALSTNAMAAAPKFAYVANGYSHNVSVYTINQTTGALTARNTVAAGRSPWSVTVDPSGRFAYVANAGSNDVWVYTIDQTTGALTAVSAVASGRKGPVSVTVDPSGRFAYVANAGNITYSGPVNMGTPDYNGIVSVYTINQTTGDLTAGTAVAAGTSPDSVTVDPSGRFAYVTNFYSHNVSVYSINQTTGALTAGTELAISNPRSFAVDPSGRFAYVAGGCCGVSVYTINQTTGALTAGSTVASEYPNSFAVDSSGRFAYATGSDNVSVYTINQTTGALTAGSTVAAGSHPTSITVDPSGRFAYVANYGSNNVSVYTINQTTGALTAGSTVAAGSSPVSVTTTAGATSSSVAGQAIEFYKSDINHYFMTADSAEVTSLDNKPSWNWVRTGKTSNVWLTQASAPGNASPVCRFYGLFANGTVGSHFYTVDQGECEYVKGRLDWGWNYEGDAFYAVKPVGGSCPSGTSPVYRVFNNGMGGAPNHRYMTSQADVDTMVLQGWVSEGTAFCGGQ